MKIALFSCYAGKYVDFVPFLILGGGHGPLAPLDPPMNVTNKQSKQNDQMSCCGHLWRMDEHQHYILECIASLGSEGKSEGKWRKAIKSKRKPIAAPSVQYSLTPRLFNTHPVGPFS